MAYIGTKPTIGNFQICDAISVVNGQAAYTMQNGGANFTDYESVNQFLVSLNGTIQAPTDSFTVSGSTLTFASNLSTGDVIDFIVVFGNSLSAGVPSDATVTTAKLAYSAVTASKITDATITSVHFNTKTLARAATGSVIVVYNELVDVTNGATLTVTASGQSNPTSTADAQKSTNRVVFTFTVPNAATTLSIGAQTISGTIKDAGTNVASDKVFVACNVIGAGGRCSTKTIAVTL